MFRSFLLVLGLLLPLPAFAQALDGDWNGVLDTPRGRLRVMFQFHNKDGVLTADLVSVAQATMALPAESVTLTGDQLAVMLSKLDSSYRGTWDSTHKIIHGTWSQNGHALPLDLTPGTIAPLKFMRAPQPGDLTLATPTGTLAGTIWHAGNGKLAALIISGAGPANRNGDSTVNGGRGTYRLIAEGLQARGITALSIDRRGIGESAAAAPPEGELRVQTYGDDVRLWAAELKRRTGTRCIWLVGHSEGALVAELAAAHNSDICGIVTLAGVGRRWGILLREQLQRALPEALKPKVFAVLDSLEAGKPVPGLPLIALLRPSAQPYMMAEINLEPAKLLAALKIPVLILQGDADETVALADAQALASARPDATFKILPGVNHSQRIAADDKGTGPLPLAPGLTDTIADFLKAHS